MTSRRTSHARKSCICKKRKFYAWEDALEELKNTRRQYELGQTHRQEDRAYLCPHEQRLWHITSSLPLGVEKGEET